MIARPGEPLSIDPQTLAGGSSIAGWVEDAAGNPLTGASVVLVPLHSGDPTSGRDALRKQSAKTSAKGFFLAGGIAAGEYRLIARAAGLSPAVVPVVTLQPRESLTWPRAIRLQEPLSVEITLDPPTAPDGKRWTIAMIDRITLDPQSKGPAVLRPASPEGKWTATGLRADLYSVEVRDANGSLVEETNLDLSGGVPAVLTLEVPAFAAGGTLTVAASRSRPTSASRPSPGNG